MQIFIANNTKALEALNPTHSVEAEFGDLVVEGSIQTLAHHGPRSDNPCPCLAEVSCQSAQNAVVAVSHVDLDTLGGLLAIGGCRPTFPGFWEAAAEIDVRGVHRLIEITSDPEVLDRLNAFWAYSAAHRVFAPRDGSAEEITGTVYQYFQTISEIIDGNAALIDAGREWAAQQETLDAESFRELESVVTLRVSDQFVNHLYRAGTCAVVALNTKFKSVTISLADPIPGISCREIVQELWGPEAGGHDGIAGSPRGREMTMQDAFAAFNKLVEEIQLW